MIQFLLAFLSWFGAFFRSRHDLGMELVALRQQVGVLKRKNPRALCTSLSMESRSRTSEESTANSLAGIPLRLAQVTEGRGGGPARSTFFHVRLRTGRPL